jgi:hypothetical protein
MNSPSGPWVLTVGVAEALNRNPVIGRAASGGPQPTVRSSPGSIESRGAGDCTHRPIVVLIVPIYELNLITRLALGRGGRLSPVALLRHEHFKGHAEVSRG